jgi:hypothetical protein
VDDDLAVQIAHTHTRTLCTLDKLDYVDDRRDQLKPTRTRTHTHTQRIELLIGSFISIRFRQPFNRHKKGISI